MTNGHAKVENRLDEKLTDVLPKKDRPYCLVERNKACLGSKEMRLLS